NTGFTEGINLGSPGIYTLQQPKVAMLIGDGVNSNDAVEAWHLLDHRFDINTSLVNAESVNRIDLSRCTVIVMADGSYGTISEIGKTRLRTWVQQGGTLVGMGNATRWLANNNIGNFNFKQGESADTARLPYASMSNTPGAQV